MAKNFAVKRVQSTRRSRASNAKLREMIEDATVDAHDLSEQTVGFLTLLEEHLQLPFETIVLGVPVTVRRLDVTDADDIVAVCSRGKHRQAVSLLSLARPVPEPAGWEWIEAYRLWARGWRA